MTQPTGHVVLRKTCPNCGQRSPLHEPLCRGCGRAFQSRFSPRGEKLPSMTVVEGPLPVLSIPLLRTRPCSRCKDAIDLDALFCPHCGWDQRVPTETQALLFSLPAAAEEPPIRVPLIERTGFVIAALVLCFPVGLVLAWKDARWSRAAKICATAAVAMFAVVCAAASTTMRSAPVHAPWTAIASPRVAAEPAALWRRTVTHRTASVRGHARHHHGHRRG